MGDLQGEEREKEGNRGKVRCMRERKDNKGKRRE
jgi:hypothetical protein